MEKKVKPENLKEISIRADYEIKNMACCHEGLDLWFNFEDSHDFKFCPFCKRTLIRTIFIPENSMIGWKLRR